MTTFTNVVTGHIRALQEEVLELIDLRGPIEMLVRELLAINDPQILIVIEDQSIDIHAPMEIIFPLSILLELSIEVLELFLTRQKQVTIYKLNT